MQSDNTAHAILIVFFGVLCVLSLSGDAFLREGRTMELKALLRKRAFPKSSRTSIHHKKYGYETDVIRKIREMDTKPWGECKNYSY